MGGFEGNEKMDVIRHATNAMGQSIETFDDTSEIGMEFGAPRGGNQRFPVLGGEDQVVIERGVG
jgi:hypothetical protein